MHSAQNKYTTHYITLQNDTIQYDTMCNIKYSSIQLVVIYPIRVGVLDVVSNSECHEQWRGAAEPLFMALGSWKPSQKHQRGLDMASHTSVHIHSNEAWNYDD